MCYLPKVIRKGTDKCERLFNSFMTEPLSYRNQSIDLLCKSMDWFMYDNCSRHEKVKCYIKRFEQV